MINVALPAIQAAFGASVATVQWIATVLHAGAGRADARRRRARRSLRPPPSARGRAEPLRRRLARRRSGAATAPRSSSARALQGLAAALVAPNSLAQLSASFPRAERGRALGIWSAVTALTGGAAPLLGGWLVDVASWRAVFLFCVPLTRAILVVVVARVPETVRRVVPRSTRSARRSPPSPSPPSTGGLIAGGRPDGSGRVCGPAARRLALLAAFVWWSRRTRRADDAAGALPFVARSALPTCSRCCSTSRSRARSSCCRSRWCRGTATRRR